MGASGLSDDDGGKNDGLICKLADPFRWRNNIFTAITVSSFSISSNRAKESSRPYKQSWAKLILQALEHYSG
jgi:hypothetical protein